MRIGATIALVWILGCSGASHEDAQPSPAPASAEAPAPSTPASETPAVALPEAEPVDEPTPEATPAEATGASSTGDPEPEPAPAATSTGPSFSVIARLTDAGRSVSHCGVMHFKVVMKYEVLEVLDGTFEPTTLYAAVSCPEMPPTKARGFAWTVGETYRLKLRTAGVRRGGARVDAFEDEPGKRYELLHIDPVEAP